MRYFQHRLCYHPHVLMSSPLCLCTGPHVAMCHHHRLPTLLTPLVYPAQHALTLLGCLVIIAVTMAAHQVKLSLRECAV